MIEYPSLDLLQLRFPPSRGTCVPGVTLWNFDAATIPENRQPTLAPR